MITNITPYTKLAVGTYCTEMELKELGLKPINNNRMDYLIFEKDSKAYFFEKTNTKLLRLFSITKRSSYYLS